ncbi:MAG: glycosyltransferase [Coriobacteriia bacterium]|nr:glycosyltransferase [Coriobacteriia bacterium]
MTQDSQNGIKGCYLYYQDIQKGSKLGGIEKKVAAQVKAFRNAGFGCDFILCEQPESVGAKVVSCLPFFSDGVHWSRAESLREYSFLYLRRPRFFSRDLIAFLQEVKRENPDLKIIVEVPTYPYDDEMRAPLLFPALLKDKRSRKRLPTCVDRIASPAQEKEIFGVGSIHMINGIDLSSIAKKEAAPSLSEVNMLAVSYFASWHGLDRLIAGMAAYYQKEGSLRDLVLHVAGDGDVIGALRKQAQAAGIEKRVLFHGYCNPEELDTLYDKSSLAIECLGLHRKNLTVSSALKSREYLAKGIPLICANEIDVFNRDPVDFCLRIPGDESPVDIDVLLDYHDRLYSSETQDDLISRIRAFAEAHVGMDQTMQDVIDFIIETYEERVT